MTAAWLFGFAGVALATFNTGVFLAGLVIANRAVAIVAGGLLLGSSLVLPYAETSLFGFLLGLVAPLGAATYALALFGAVAFLSGRPAVAARDEVAFAAVFAVAGLVLYLSALGYLPFDLYAYGYNWRTVMLALAALLILALALRSSMLAAVVLVGIGFRLAGAVDSENGWDYFLDPVAWIVTVALVILHLWPCLTGRAVPLGRVRLSSRPRSGDPR